MATQALSFRLSGNQLQWLEEQRADDESINQTAKRLFQQFIDTHLDTKLDTSVDTQDLEVRLKEEIDARFEELYNKMAANLNYILDTRLGTVKDDSVEDSQVNQTNVDTLDTKLDTLVDTKLDSLLNTSLDSNLDTQVDIEQTDLETKTVGQLRQIAKSLEIPYTTRTKKAELINLINQSNSYNHHIQKTHKKP